MGSTRLPGKVMLGLGRKRVLGWVVNAAQAAIGVDEAWVATTTEERDDEIVQWCIDRDINYWRGSETDVLRRFAECAQAAKADIVVRLTGDCPFADPRIIGEVVALREHTNVAYASNVDPPSFPDGLDAEAFTAKALYAAEAEASLPTDRDTVTRFISRNRLRWPSATLACGIGNLASERWVLDTAEDLKFCKAVVAKLGRRLPSLLTILEVLRKHAELRDINRMWIRNERYFQAVASE
jgi:spore coat polysaccharide biosynthesis protein SpsF (cytidylyltransferase family)